MFLFDWMDDPDACGFVLKFLICILLIALGIWIGSHL